MTIEVDPNELTRTAWSYEFKELGWFAADRELERPGLKAYVARTRTSFQKIAKAWTAEAHTEWSLRQYIALKLVMASSIQIGSADHAYERNLQMAVPYLSYYAIFNSMRANLLTSPRQSWGAKTLMIGHDQARDRYMSELGHLLSSDEIAVRHDLAIEAKAGRELFSYRFPAAGAPGIGGFFVYRDDAEEFARLAGELALLNSFLLCEAVEERFADDPDWVGYAIGEDAVETLWNHALRGANGDETIHFDAGDRFYASRMARKCRKPVPFIHLIGEGGVDNFFGVLTSTVDDQEAFDPDDHWDRVLDLP